MKIYYNQYDAQALREYSLEDGTSMVASRSSWFPECDAENKLPRTENQILELMPSLWEDGKDIITTNPIPVYWVLRSMNWTTSSLDKDDRKFKEVVIRPSDITFVSVRWNTYLSVGGEERVLVHEIKPDDYGNFTEPWPGGFDNIRLDVIC